MNAKCLLHTPQYPAPTTMEAHCNVLPLICLKYMTPSSSFLLPPFSKIFLTQTREREKKRKGDTMIKGRSLFHVKVLMKELVGPPLRNFLRMVV